MMRHGWWAYPPNRRRAGLTGGAGTVIAAISAGLIAGLSQHTSWTEPPTLHRVADSAPNNSNTTVGIKPARHPAAAITVAPGTPDQGAPPASALNATSIPAPPPAPAAQALAAGAENSGTHSDEFATPRPSTAPTTSGSALPSLQSDGSTTFRPYTHNGPTGTASQTTSGPAGTTTITTPPSRRPVHTTAQHTRAATSSAEHTGDRKRDNSTPTDTDPHGTEQAADESTDTAGQSSNSSGSQAQSRVAAALPPGFSPIVPRQATTSPVLLPAAAVPSSGLASQSAPTAADSTMPSDAGASQPGATQPGPAQIGLGQPVAVPGPVPASNTRLVPVPCPAAVANATCYQPAQASSPTTPGTYISPTGSSELSPAGAGARPGQEAVSSVPSISSTPGTGASPTVLPNPGSTRLAASEPSTTSSADCQASGNHTEAGVRAQNWGDLTQLIMDRIQDCIEQGMSNGGSEWNTTTSSGTKKSHDTASTSGTSASTSGESDSSGKHASASGVDSPSASSQKQRHKD